MSLVVFYQKMSPQGAKWAPQTAQKSRKSIPKVDFFIERVPEAILERFGVDNEVKMSQNPSRRRTENENGDFSKIVLCCRRQHDSWGSETSKIEQKSEKNEEKTHCKKSNEKKQLFIDFWLILAPFWGQNLSKKTSKTGSIFKTKGRRKKLTKTTPKPNDTDWGEGCRGKRSLGRVRDVNIPSTKNKFETYWFSNTPLGQRPGEFLDYYIIILLYYYSTNSVAIGVLTRW